MKGRYAALSDENRSRNDPELEDLLADYNIVISHKQPREPASSKPAEKHPQAANAQMERERNASAASHRTAAQNRSGASAPVGDVPRKPDGTPYSLEELRQIQASRKAMYARQSQPRPEQRTSSQPRETAAGNIGQTSPESAYEAAYRQHGSGGQKRPSYRRRKPDKPSGAVLLMALLLVAVGAISIGQIVRNQNETGETGDVNPPAVQDSQTGDAADPAEGTEPDTDTVPEEDTVLWKTVTVENTDIHRGELILVNYQYPYPEADTVAVRDVYGNKNPYYKLASTNIALTDVTLQAFNAMTERFYADTGVDDMIVNSGYRNVPSQQKIYDDRVASQGKEMADLYVATPGYSEHHTGMAMDLSFYTDEGATVSIENHEFGSWLHEHCVEYGFVLRYPSNKVDITKIGYEFWHYRYVGHPHAEIMTEKELCLEEYIDFIKEYSTDQKLLWIQPGGVMADVSSTALPGEGCLVYYVPASAGETTDIQVPRGNVFENIRISGNNTDGFIVTVDIG